ncbi:C6 zinc finger domain-containing protein [Colletotrichum musicola]|uniref:C6 zinc finger domain-containing protein n=1 Tax=Colletotrichum musicola TaxID=2175873 RepID=A0A8H6KIX8_9PEZI|nr:C6 zinc finger domain-containing protein [Colletotrichum musicola]
MASLARPAQGQSRAEEKRGKSKQRDTSKPIQKPRRPLFTVSQHRKAPAYPASWAQRWKHRQQQLAAPRVHSPQYGITIPTPAESPASSSAASSTWAVSRRGTPRGDEDMEVDGQELELVLPANVDVGPEVYTLGRFYTNYATTASIVFFNRLPAHYDADLSDASHTRHATHAVALASASRQLRQSGLMVEARRHYGKAIARLNQALKDPVRVRDDSNLVTLFLFGMFEVIVGKRSSKVIDLEQNVFPHGVGGLQLFKFRAEHGLTNEVDKGSFTFFCHAALMEMFIQREHLAGIWTVLEEVETPWGKGPILEPLVRQVVDFKKAFDFKVQVQGSSSSDAGKFGPPEDLMELVDGGVSLCGDLEAAVTLLSFSGANSFSGQPQKVFNGLFSLSSEVSIATARSHYRSLKVFVLERVIDLGNILKEASESTGDGMELGPLPTWADGVAAVEEVLDDIRIVFGLEGKEAPTDGLPYRTMTMFWPMVLVRTSCFAGPHNGRWVAERMLELTSESGFGLGVEAASL